MSGLGIRAARPAWAPRAWPAGTPVATTFNSIRQFIESQQLRAGAQWLAQPGTTYVDYTTGVTAYIDASGNLVPGTPPGGVTALYTNTNGQYFEPAPIGTPISTSAGTGTVSGVATRPDGRRPLPCARVTITGAGGGSGLMTVAGGDGSWAAALPPGTYTVTVAGAGYQPGSDTVTIVAGEHVNMGSIGVARYGEPPVTRATPTPGAGGVLRGRVVSAGGAQAPIKGAQVAFNLGERVALTNDEGRFSFGTVPPGAAVVDASAPGYQRSSWAAMVADGDVVEGTIELTATGAAGPRGGGSLLPLLLLGGALAVAVASQQRR